jgi:integrase
MSSADRLLTKRKGGALQGKNLPELRKRTVAFAELADDTVKYVEGRYARPADDVARMKLLRERFANRAAESITAGEIENMLDALSTEKNWSPSSRDHHHNLLSLAFRLGILHGKVKESPLRGLRRKPENNFRVRYLTPEEEKKLRAAVRSDPAWAPHEPELDLAIATGLRRGSMYAATWEDVDSAACTLTIPRTKNGDPITLPLNPNALRALSIFRLRGDGTGRIVRNSAGKSLSYNADWFVPAVRAAGIKHFRWHDCRHTFASRLRQAGVPRGNIAELLGHKGLAMTKRYAHLSNLQFARGSFPNRE